MVILDSAVVGESSIQCFWIYTFMFQIHFLMQKWRDCCRFCFWKLRAKYPVPGEREVLSFSSIQTNSFPLQIYPSISFAWNQVIFTWKVGFCKIFSGLQFQYWPKRGDLIWKQNMSGMSANWLRMWSCEISQSQGPKPKISGHFWCVIEHFQIQLKTELAFWNVKSWTHRFALSCWRVLVVILQSLDLHPWGKTILDIILKKNTNTDHGKKVLEIAQPSSISCRKLFSATSVCVCVYSCVYVFSFCHEIHPLVGITIPAMGLFISQSPPLQLREQRTPTPGPSTRTGLKMLNLTWSNCAFMPGSHNTSQNT